MDDLLEIRNDGTAKQSGSFWINEEGTARHIEKNPDASSDAPIIDHVNRDLEKAYEKDLERKLLREDELQAARDYMKVLLEEVEDCNRQLARKNHEILELKALLMSRDGRLPEGMDVPEVQDASVNLQGADSADVRDHPDTVSEEISADTAETLNRKQGGKGAAFVMIFELIAIIGLILALVSSKGLFGRKNWDSTGTNSGQTAVSNDSPDNMAETKPSDTVRYISDLASTAGGIQTGQSGYSCRVSYIDGLEYLTFTKGDLSISYKNEYYSDDMSFRKTVVVEHNGDRIAFNKGYDLAGDMSLLCPETVTLEGEDFLLFVDHSGEGETASISSMRLVNAGSLASYVASDITEQIAGCFKSGILQGQKGTEKNPAVLGVNVNTLGFKFAIPLGYYDSLMFGGQTIPYVDPALVLKDDGSGLGWSAVLSLGEAMYIGYATGSFVVSNGEITAVCDDFKPFVTAQSADIIGERAIEPLTYIPSHVITACDLAGNSYLVPFMESAEKPLYSSMNLDDSDPNDHVYRDDDGNRVSYRGIDVSKYHGTIDWKTVAESGIDYAMIRMGYRGMNAGGLETDDNFRTNISEADLYGINVGVYFVSQAVNGKEAVEEADYVINSVRGYNVSYPIVLDMEYVSTYAARANDITAAERTDVCVAFCKRILEAGYKPMVSADSAYLLLGMDVSELNGIDIRYVETENGSEYPYAYTMLRYSSEGDVPGVPEKCGLDVSFVDYSAE